MLTRQQAEERLKAYQDTKKQTATLMRLAILPPGLPSIGQVLVRNGPVWAGIFQDQSGQLRIQQQTDARLARLGPLGRRLLFGALFPRMGRQVEAAWKLFDRLPYQVGYLRRPFRLPGRPSPAARIAWLRSLVFVTRTCPDQDAVWYAAWAPHLPYGAMDEIGYLCAGAIEAGGATGQAVYETLIASANGTHEIGTMGRHVVRGLLCSSRPEGWDFVERLLLSAQREEGLRQVILESVDEAQPRAFRRMLQLILDHNLTRFSATVRAFSVWFGLPFEAVNQRAVHEILGRVAGYLDSPEACARAVREGAPQEAYYALWATAFEDAMAALPGAIDLRRSPGLERRYAGTHFLAQLELKKSLEQVLESLLDEDLRIAAAAFAGLNRFHRTRAFLGRGDLFERLEKLLGRIREKKTSLKPLVWDWLPVPLDRAEVAAKLTECLGSRSPLRLLPHVRLMNPHGRSRVVELIKGLGRKDASARQALLELAGDPSSWVRESALKVLKGFRLEESEAVQVEALLTRKSEDVRRGVIQLLLDLPDGRLLESMRRLLAQKDAAQRLAGVELLRECRKAGRGGREVRRLAAELHDRPGLTEAEMRMLEDVLAEAVEQVSLEDGLGLMDPGGRTPALPPGRNASGPRVRLGSPAAVACLRSLNELVETHRNDAVEVNLGEGRRTGLLGNVQWGLPAPDPSLPLDQDLKRLPQAEIWEAWWRSRPEALRDPDGFELVRAMAILHLADQRWENREYISYVPEDLQKAFGIHLDFKLVHMHVLQMAVLWLCRAHPVEGETDFILDALEAWAGALSQAEAAAESQLYNNKSRKLRPQKLAWLHVAHWQRAFRARTWNDGHHARLWRLVRWLDEPEPGRQRLFSVHDHEVWLGRETPFARDVLYAWRAGAAGRDDLIDLCFGHHRGDLRYGGFAFLVEFSGRKPHPLSVEFPVLQEVVDACRERVLSIEVRRGDLPTAATGPALSIRSVPGMKNLFRLLAALGKSDFERGWIWDQSRSGVLSHLIRNSYPLGTDTQEDFDREAGSGHVPERRLVELAVYAPQWAAFVEARLKWPRFGEAVWWVYAHTKDRQWRVEESLREEWAVRISEYTPLAADRLMDGAVDVAWFQRIHAELGEERWQQVHRAAEFAAGGAGHTRARLFADAMLGRVAAGDLVERIGTKRHQDSVRALGLVPLAEAADRTREILRRYECMQEFLRTGRKFGSQRKASEKLAVAVGMENLARTAGYPDPQRLEWAMEIEAVGDLAEGPVRVEMDGIEVTLAVDELGEPQLAFSRGGKALKALPPAVRRDEAIAALLERKQGLDRQVSRMRLSLEGAMCRGDVFSGAELGTLFRHPMLRVMIEQLVFVSPRGMGYPVRGGEALKSHQGRPIRIGAGDGLRIAHPLDLLESDDWPAWQHECFVSERIQPFKQVFRELYVPTRAERSEGDVSRRYAGQQVNPRQAAALLGSRGWVVSPEEGVRKTFHEAGITARLGFLDGIFTPAEVEGLTLEAVGFTRRGGWMPMPFEQIPARIFSEVMRDLDLVVSVAHAGGVDPEASASSIEARSALVRETCGLLGLANVELSGSHVLIEGRLGRYNVHLGSGVVHKQPGGALCIIPVHSQQRGRLFLPFVDNDPKTAEIVAKTLLLARDDQIRDPTILEQIV